jgi:basic membrane protein A and related proteins
MGTPIYVPPEQIEGKKIDGRADIYSLGVVAYHMVAGRPPFAGDDPLAVAVKHLQEAPRPPSELRPDLPNDWQELILKALAKDPARRFQSAAELRAAIEALTTEAVLPPAEAQEGHTSWPKVLGPRFLATVGGGLIAALVIVVILFRAHASEATPSSIVPSCVPALVSYPYDGTLLNAAHAGFLRAATKLGVKKPPTYAVGPTGDFNGQLTRAATQHPCLVVVVGLLQTNVLTELSQHFPKVHFALVDAITLDPMVGFVSRPNVEDIVFRTQESGYLAGYLAGLMEKMKVGRATHGVIGVMGGMPEPQVDSYINGYELGARAAYPSIRILSEYANTFVDQVRGRAIGASQISRGADILFGVAGGTDAGYLDAAQQRGVYGIGVDTDQSPLGRFVLSSALKRFDTGVYEAIMAAARGHFKGGIQTLGLTQGATGIGKPSKLVPPPILAMVKAQAKKIARGRITDCTWACAYLRG